MAAEAFETPMAEIVAQSGASKLTQPNILCCLCGASIQPNSANMCVTCIRAQVRGDAAHPSLAPGGEPTPNVLTRAYLLRSTSPTE